MIATSLLVGGHLLIESKGKPALFFQRELARKPRRLAWTCGGKLADCLGDSAADCKRLGFAPFPLPFEFP
jgi:hypothetical protein